MIARSKNKTAGFTAIEMVVVVGVITILAGIVLANMIPLLQDAKVARFGLELNQCKTALTKLYADVSLFPATPADATADPGLVTKPITPVLPNWKGPYISRWPQVSSLNGRFKYVYANINPTEFPNTNGIDDEVRIDVDQLPNSSAVILKTIDENFDDGNANTGLIHYRFTGGFYTVYFFVAEGPSW